MQQQINLYRYLPHPIKSFLDLKILALLSGGFAGFLMLFYLFGLIHEQYLLSHLNKINTSLADSRQHLQQIAAEYPELDISQFAMNASKIAACKIKFSPFLEGFAKAVVPGAWLTNISIANNGTLISLKGYATRGIEAQEFLERINKQSTFTTRPFVMQDLSQPIEPISAKPSSISNVLSFYLTTEVPQ
ncbi:MAG: hypothetical protein P4M14_03365 [Gammaproteobacteria bacterium]|nr:hypothetical protein [Gammaproteobacteria bacterium]